MAEFGEIARVAGPGLLVLTLGNVGANVLAAHDVIPPFPVHWTTTDSTSNTHLTSVGEWRITNLQTGGEDMLLTRTGYTFGTDLNKLIGNDTDSMSDETDGNGPKTWTDFLRHLQDRASDYGSQAIWVDVRANADDDTEGSAADEALAQRAIADISTVIPGATVTGQGATLEYHGAANGTKNGVVVHVWTYKPASASYTCERDATAETDITDTTTHYQLPWLVPLWAPRFPRRKGSGDDETFGPLPEDGLPVLSERGRKLVAEYTAERDAIDAAAAAGLPAPARYSAPPRASRPNRNQANPNGGPGCLGIGAVVLTALLLPAAYRAYPMHVGDYCKDGLSWVFYGCPTPDVPGSQRPDQSDTQVPQAPGTTPGVAPSTGPTRTSEDLTGRPAVGPRPTPEPTCPTPGAVTTVTITTVRNGMVQGTTTQQQVQP